MTALAAPGTPGPPRLPSKPSVVIEPGAAWSPVNWADLWAHRELLYFLAWRDVKVRYKQTALGVAWVVMQPVLMTLIFTVFLGVLARVPTDGPPYPLMVYAGLLPWTFFSNSVMQGGSSIVGNSNLVTKVYFPRLIVPAAAVAARLVDVLVSLVILAGMMAYYRVGLTWHAAALPAMLLLLTLVSLGLGLLVAALNVRYRDVGVALPVLLQLWMFASPVLYPSGLVADRWPAGYRFYSLNPMVGVVDGFRSSLFGRPFDLPALAYSAAFTLVLLAFALYYFRRVEKSFADVI